MPEHLVGYRKHSTSMSSNNEQIIRSWRLVYEQLADAGFDFSPEMMRWNTGFFRMGLAENRAASGRYREAGGQLAGALAADPMRSGAYVLYRLARTGARLLRGRQPRPVRVPFDESHAERFIDPDPDAIQWLARLLTRIDRKRLDRLTRS